MKMSETQPTEYECEARMVESGRRNSWGEDSEPPLHQGAYGQHHKLPQWGWWGFGAEIPGNLLIWAYFYLKITLKRPNKSF